MSGGKDPDDDRRVFEEAMRGVERLASEERSVKIVGRPRPRRSRAEIGAPVRFQVETWGEHLEGLAPGVDRRTLRRLRQGRVPVDRTLDLHGLDAASAQERVADTLRRMGDRGERCLLIVHGRGLHSESWPVLKQALTGWLAAPPHGRRVLAFVSAPVELGGTGATLVLLRRRR